jgi:hypothetical protein
MKGESRWCRHLYGPDCQIESARSQFVFLGELNDEGYSDADIGLAFFVRAQSGR